jgi:Tat protein secretion system quality control protein TatD with DNase activity
VEAAGRGDRALDAQPLARGLGEIGLDYHYDFSPRDLQASGVPRADPPRPTARLPIVIHTREAEDDTFALLAEESASDVGGVFHCFTGNRDMARRALDIGFHLSLAGIVTFPRALELQEVARMVPLDRLLVETDSPYLAPVPHPRQAQRAGLRCPRRRSRRGAARNARGGDRREPRRPTSSASSTRDPGVDSRSNSNACHVLHRCTR